MKRFALVVILLLITVAGIAYSTRDNFDAVIPGEVYRSAQLSGERLRQVVRDNDIRSVINLRPIREEGSDWYPEEMAAVRELGIDHQTLGMSQTTPRVDNILALRELLDEAEQPILVHCASGVDRTGLASVMILLRQGEQSPQEIQRHVSWRYGAISPDSIGKLFLAQYRDWLEQNQQSHSPGVFEQWLENDYVDPSGNFHFYIHPIRGQIWGRPYGLYSEGVKFNISRSESPVLHMDGWAFDTRNQAPLADIAFSLGDVTLAKAEYGLHYDWLINDFGKQEYLDTGWSVDQPLDEITDGCHDLRMTFYRQDGSQWQTPPAGRFCIGP
jgi:protein tyrosine phosphatase (PTP) superfamily phosphohydrolase (DUF442 family)